jgi:tripartite-type tricarboxylate transporter receptor subunit TctC
VLIVPKDSPFNTLQDLVDFAKQNPKKVTVSGAGMFVGHHIALLQFKISSRQGRVAYKLSYIISG